MLNMLQISSKSWKVQTRRYLQNFVICHHGVVVGWADPDDGVLVDEVVILDMVEGIMTLDMVEEVMMQDMVEEAVILIMEGGGLLLLAEVEAVGLTMTPRG